MPINDGIDWAEAAGKGARLYRAGEAGYKGWAKWNNTSTANDGGDTTMKSSAGSVQTMRFGKRKRKRLSVHQKAHAAYAMVKELMPRMKTISWVMYNSLENSSGSVFTSTRLLSGKTASNTVSVLVDRSAIGSGSIADQPYYNQIDVIPSGLSCLVKNSSNNSKVIQTLCFPLSHVGLVMKGDNGSERLTDFMELSGLHIHGRIECNIFYPVVFSTQVPYVLTLDTVGAASHPRSGYIDQKRKVRFMLIEVLDNLDTAPSAWNDDQFYGTTVWQEKEVGVALADALQVSGAPRLENILELPSQSTTAPDMRSARAGRWTGIDRKYRGNHLNTNLWEAEDQGRTVNFKVWKDITYTLKPKVSPKSNRNATTESNAQSYQIGETSYVNVDFFVKMNVDLSYKSRAASSTQTDYAAHLDNANRHFYWYLFDDSLDNIISSGTTDPRPVTVKSWVDGIVNDGYARTQAFLECDVFFNDDL